MFSLCNTLFLANYTIYPWIGSGIFRLAVFCRLKKERAAADSHTFPLVSLQQGLLIPPFSAWAEHLCWSFFCLHSQRSERFYMAWMEVCTNTSGWSFIWEGGSSPSKTWSVVCVSSHRFWQPRGFLSAGALLVSFCRESQTQAVLSNPCVCLNILLSRWWVPEETITYFQQPG